MEALTKSLGRMGLATTATNIAAGPRRGKKKKRAMKEIEYQPQSQEQGYVHDLTSTADFNRRPIHSSVQKKECNRLLGIAKICERDMDWPASIQFYEEAVGMLREILAATSKSKNKNLVMSDSSTLLVTTEKKIFKLRAKVAKAEKLQKLQKQTAGIRTKS